MSEKYDRFGKCVSCMHCPPHATKCHNAAGTCRYFYYDLGDNHQEMHEEKTEGEHAEESENEI